MTIDFEKLPSTAVDMSKVTDEELMIMSQEIMINAETLTEGFTQGF